MRRTIRDVRDQVPPFDIHLTDGRVVTVLTPDHIMISPRNDEFAVYERDGSLRIIDGKLVTSITRKRRKPQA
jgi:hypothetical protein